jgi:hypothetical protein
LAEVIFGKAVPLPRVPRLAVTSARFRLRLAAFALLVAGMAVAHEKATGIVAARMKAKEDSAAQAMTSTVP